MSSSSTPPCSSAPPAATSSFISISSAALLTLAIIVLVEFGLSFVPEDRFTRNARIRAHEMATMPAPQVQIFGDSVADGGINERLIAAELGLPDSTLMSHCVAGVTAYCAYPMLKRQIEAGRVPGAIVLAYNSRSYCVVRAYRFLGRFANWEDVVEARSLGLSLEDWLHSVFSRWSFSLRYREELNAMIRFGEGWEFFDPERTPGEDHLARMKRQPLARPAVVHRKKVRECDATCYGIPFKRNLLIENSIKAFFELARAHQIKVYLVSMPKPVEASKLHQRNGFDQGYYSYMDSLAKEYGATWLLREQNVLPATDFSDAVHLTPTAAFDFSLQLAGIFKEKGLFTGESAQARRPKEAP